MSFFSRLRSALPSAPLGDGSEPRPTPAAASTGSPDAHLDARLGALIATQGVSKEGDLEEALAIMKELLDKEDKSASARTIVDNWERLGGWVSGHHWIDCADTCRGGSISSRRGSRGYRSSVFRAKKSFPGERVRSGLYHAKSRRTL